MTLFAALLFILFALKIHDATTLLKLCRSGLMRVWMGQCLENLEIPSWVCQWDIKVINHGNHASDTTGSVQPGHEFTGNQWGFRYEWINSIAWGRQKSEEKGCSVLRCEMLGDIRNQTHHVEQTDTYTAQSGNVNKLKGFCFFTVLQC